MTAVFESDAIRPTTRGGHLAAYEAVRAQLDPPMGKILRRSDRMRRQRHDAENPPRKGPALTPDDVSENVSKAADIIELSQRVHGQMSPF